MVMCGAGGTVEFKDHLAGGETGPSRAKELHIKNRRLAGVGHWKDGFTVSIADPLDIARLGVIPSQCEFFFDGCRAAVQKI